MSVSVSAGVDDWSGCCSNVAPTSRFGKVLFRTGPSSGFYQDCTIYVAMSFIRDADYLLAPESFTSFRIILWIHLFGALSAIR